MIVKGKVTSAIIFIFLWEGGQQHAGRIDVGEARLEFIYSCDRLKLMYVYFDFLRGVRHRH